MKSILRWSAPLLLVLPLLAPILDGQTFQSGPASTALIELYTSEGCSSCPPAEHWLSELKTSKNLWTEFVPIAFHITYWDDLGWPDAYARPAFTQRQRTYAALWNAPNIYTPEFIYQGREWHPGLDKPTPTQPGVLILQRQPDGSGTLTFTPTNPSPDKTKTYEASIVLLGCDIAVKVSRGENAGRTLSHDFIALHLTNLRLVPSATDGTLSASFPAPPANLPSAGRHALAAWISLPDNPAPLQATGGWLK